MLKIGWLFLRREKDDLLDVVQADKYRIVFHERRLYAKGYFAVHDRNEAGFHELAIGLTNLYQLVTSKGLVGFFDRM